MPNEIASPRHPLLSPRSEVRRYVTRLFHSIRHVRSQQRNSSLRVIARKVPAFAGRRPKQSHNHIASNICNEIASLHCVPLAMTRAKIWIARYLTGMLVNAVIMISLKGIKEFQNLRSISTSSSPLSIVSHR